MTIANAVRTLAKHGEVKHYGGNPETWNGFWFVEIGTDAVEVFSCGQGPDREAVISVRSATHDGCGATFFPSLRSAIRCASRTMAS